jgi:coenzyme F420-dependent glucose-6-phosphate dehydrogenase
MTSFAWMCALEVFQPESLLRQAELAERAGFDAVTVSDPFHPWVDDAGAAGDAWTWLGAAAARTDRIRLITTVTAAWFRHHPAVIAQASATLDRLSGGRFALGVGTGLAIHEAPLGAPSMPAPDRLERLVEAVTAMRALWSGEEVTLAGDHFRLDHVRLATPPLRPIPVWMAADGPRAATTAGRIADGLITSVKDVERTRTRVIEPFREAAAPRGPLPVLATRWCVLAGDEEEAWRAVRPLRGLRAPGRDTVTSPRVLRERADALDRSEVLASYPVASGARDLVEIYGPLARDLAADLVSIQVATAEPERAIELIGKEVLPALR